MGARQHPAQSGQGKTTAGDGRAAPGGRRGRLGSDWDRSRRGLLLEKGLGLCPGLLGNLQGRWLSGCVMDPKPDEAGALQRPVNPVPRPRLSLRLPVLDHPPEQRGTSRAPLQLDRHLGQLRFLDPHGGKSTCHRRELACLLEDPGVVSDEGSDRPQQPTLPAAWRPRHDPGMTPTEPQKGPDRTPGRRAL